MVGWEPSDSAVVRILHVDDDESILDLTATYLERLDDRFEVTSALGASEGLDVLASEPVDCIVSDYQMPALNGLEFLERVRESHPELPFVLFTGEGSEEVASDAIAAGATDYVPKGPGSDHFEVLANRISNAVEGRRASVALRRTAERFRELAESAPVPIGVIDGDGTIAYLNDAALDFFEVDDADAIIGTDAFDRVHPDDRARAGERVRRVIEDGATPEAVETRFVTHAGREKLGFVNSAPVEFQGETAAQVVVNDVTRAHRAETELAQQEALTGSLLDALDGMFFAFEVGEGLVRWNERVETVTGYDADELEGMTPEAFTPAAVVEETAAAVEGLSTDERVRYDGAIETASGESIPYEFTETRFEIDGSRYRVGIGQDISERVARERRLRDRTEQLETIVEHFPVILFVLDDEGTFKRSTGAGLSKLGIEPGEVVGESIYDVYADHDAIIAGFERALAGDPTATTVTVADRTFDTRYEPVETAEGVSQVVGVAFDVTERERQRAALEEQNARLEGFADVVSHDLRNPLGVASSAFDLVADYVESRAEADASWKADGDGGDAGGDDGASRGSLVDVRENVETVRHAHDRMDRIIDDVLALARDDGPLNERAVDAGSVVEAALEHVQLGDASVSVDLDEIVLADRDSMLRLVENLVRNAVDHGGDRIHVGGLDDRTGDAPSGGDANDGSESGEDATDGAEAVGFYVADDGAGIDPAERDAVLEPGVTMDDDGIGLGLAIVSNVAGAHGWRVVVTDDADLGGARIEIRDVTPA
jgi:PAS domain S-box-containing protein